MKKAIKITLYAIFAVLVLFGIFHDFLIRSLIRQIFDEKSKGKIELSIESFHLGLHYGSITIDKAALKFADYYINRDNSLKLEKVEFRKIQVEDLDFWALITRKEIVAGYFNIEKPEFVLSEHGKHLKTEIQPKGFVNSLDEESNSFEDLMIKIDSIAIHYGSIMMSRYKLPGIDPGNVDFTIKLKGFNTKYDTSQVHHILYSRSFSFKLKSIHNVIGREYNLKIDSVMFDSEMSDLIISGLSVRPVYQDSLEGKIDMESKRIELNSIRLEELSELKDLNLSSVKISGTKLISYFSDPRNKKSLHKKNNGFNGILNHVVLDTLDIDDFVFYGVRNNDTLITANDVSLKLSDVEMDSTVFKNAYRNVGFEDIALNTGRVDISGLIPGVRFGYDDMEYANYDRELVISGITINDDNSVEGTEININVPRFKIDGLMAHKLQSSRKQSVSVFLNEPVIDIRIPDSKEKNDSTSFKFPPQLADYFFYRFNITGGSVKFSQGKKFTSDIEGLDLIVNGLRFPANDTDKITLETVKASTDVFKAGFNNDSVSFETGDLTYSEDKFKLADIELSIVTPDTINTLKAGFLSVNGFDQGRLFYDDELVIDTVELYRPVLTGGFDLSKKTHTDTLQSKGKTIPLYIYLKRLLIRRGEVNSTFIVNNNSAGVKTGFDLTAGPFYAEKGDSVNNVIKKINWKLELNNTGISASGHKMVISDLVTSSFDSVFYFNGLKIAVNGPPADSGSFIRSAGIPSFKISGLDYATLINEDSLAFETISLTNPSFDIVLDAPGKEAEDSVRNKKMYKIPGIGFDTLLIDNLEFSLDIRKEGKLRGYDLRGFDFRFLYKAGGSNNIAENVLKLKFNGFVYSDITSGDIMQISDCYLDENTNSLRISGIKGDNLSRYPDSIGLKNSYSFITKGMELSNIDILKDLPTKITGRKLSVDKFVVDIVSKAGEKKEKKSLPVKSLSVKKIKDYLTLFRIDTISFKDLSFDNTSFTDSSKKVMKLDSIGILLKKIQIDTLTDENKTSLIDKITIDLYGKTKVTSDSLYEMYAEKIHYNFPDQKITIDSFYLSPLYESDEFFRKAKYQTDRIDLFIPKLEVDGINLDELFAENHLHIDHVDVYKMRTEMYRDKHYPMKPGIYKKLPRELLMDIDRKFTIDSVLVHDSYLKYKEKSEKADEPGEVFFDDLSLSLYNITNRLKENEKLDLIFVFDGKVMGEAGVYANVHFPLNEDSVSFWMTGKTERLELSSLNPLTTNLLGIGIIKGLGSVDIRYIEATDSVARGNLVFRYKKLRIHPYSRKKEKLKKGPLTPILKFMINDLVVKSNNPKFARRPRIGQVYFVRDTRKSVINYIWKSTLSGLISTMGFNNREQRKEKKDK